MRTKGPISQTFTRLSTDVNTWSQRVDIVPAMSKKPSRRREPREADSGLKKDTAPVRANVNPEIATGWRRSCQRHGIGLNEAMERLLRWFTAQDQTTQQFFLGVVPAELRMAVTSHVIEETLEWFVRSTDVELPIPSKIGAAEVDRLRDVARLYHITLPATRNPDGSIEQITRTYERTGSTMDRGKQTDESDSSSTPPITHRPINGGSKQGAA